MGSRARLRDNPDIKAIFKVLHCMSTGPEASVTMFYGYGTNIIASTQGLNVQCKRTQALGLGHQSPQYGRHPMQYGREPRPSFSAVWQVAQALRIIDVSIIPES